jgi:hypothetical protein
LVLLSRIALQAVQGAGHRQASSKSRGWHRPAREGVRI